MTIPRVLDASIAGAFIQYVHVAVIVFYGLLEPLRAGWPGEQKPYIWT